MPSVMFRVYGTSGVSKDPPHAPNMRVMQQICGALFLVPSLSLPPMELSDLCVSCFTHTQHAKYIYTYYIYIYRYIYTQYIRIVFLARPNAFVD